MLAVSWLGLADVTVSLSASTSIGGGAVVGEGWAVAEVRGSEFELEEKNCRSFFCEGGLCLRLSFGGGASLIPGGTEAGFPWFAWVCGVSARRLFRTGEAGEGVSATGSPFPGGDLGIFGGRGSPGGDEFFLLIISRKFFPQEWSERGF